MDFESLIIQNIDNPGELESLFRTNPEEFKHAFNKYTPWIKNQQYCNMERKVVLS